MTVSVLFVCLGNICRSPTAHGVFDAMLEQQGLADVISVDSAATSDWNIGRSPDPRTQAAARLRGYDLSHIRARQVRAEDFQRFDYILAMDNSNLANLQRLQPADFSGQLALFLRYADLPQQEVPDPYHGDDDGFDAVLDMVEQGAAGLLAHLRQDLVQRKRRRQG